MNFLKVYFQERIKRQRIDGKEDDRMQKGERKGIEIWLIQNGKEKSNGSHKKYQWQSLL